MSVKHSEKSESDPLFHVYSSFITFEEDTCNTSIDLPCYVRYAGSPNLAYDIEIPNQNIQASHRLILLKRLGFELPSHGTLGSVGDFQDLMRNFQHGHTLYILNQNAYVKQGYVRDIKAEE